MNFSKFFQNFNFNQRFYKIFFQLGTKFQKFAPSFDERD